MTYLPVLALSNFSKGIHYGDGCFRAWLGAVLMQEQRPLSFFSHALNPIDWNKLVYERELMEIVFAVLVYERELIAIVFAMKKWRHYLLG